MNATRACGNVTPCNFLVFLHLYGLSLKRSINIKLQFVHLQEDIMHAHTCKQTCNGTYLRPAGRFQTQSGSKARDIASQVFVLGVFFQWTGGILQGVGLHRAAKLTDKSYTLRFDRFTFCQKQEIKKYIQKRKRKKKLGWEKNWTSLGIRGRGHLKITTGGFQQSAPLLSRPSLPLCWCVSVGKTCDSVVCSLVLCDHVWPVCWEKKKLKTFQKQQHLEKRKYNKPVRL